MNATNPTTEADVLAYLNEVREKYAPLFPDVRELRAGTYIDLRSPDSSEVTLGGYINDQYDTASGFGKTFEEAAKALRAKLGTSAEKAAKLREQAAKLLAEAEQLTPATT